MVRMAGPESGGVNPLPLQNVRGGSCQSQGRPQTLWCCGCREGVYGRCWGLSEALQRWSGGRSSPAGVGCGWREHSLVWNQETGGGGGPTGGVVARSPVQNPAGAWGSGLVGRDPPGSLTIRVVHSLSGSWALGFQPWKGRRPEEKYFKYTLGIIEKKISIFSKKATLLLKSQFCQSLF